MKSLIQATAEAIESAKNSINGRIEYAVFNTETGEYVPKLCYTGQQVAQWDYTPKDWEAMDFELLAEETLKNLGIDVDERKIYKVK